MKLNQIRLSSLWQNRGKERIVIWKLSQVIINLIRPAERVVIPRFALEIQNSNGLFTSRNIQLKSCLHFIIQQHKNQLEFAVKHSKESLNKQKTFFKNSRKNKSCHKYRVTSQ